MAYKDLKERKGDLLVVESVISEEDLRTLFTGIKYGIPLESDWDISLQEKVKAVNTSEVEEVRRRRKLYPPAKNAPAPDPSAPGALALDGSTLDAVGLAFSGGGIRSATFCLGVTQVLADKELLKDVDFLSTVSGGGYTGSFISARLRDSTDLTRVGRAKGPDSGFVRHLRHHAQYLGGFDLKDRWRMATITFAGMILNWTAPVSVVAVLALAESLLIEKPGPGSEVLESFCFILLEVSSFCTGLALVAYGGLMRFCPKYTPFGEGLLGGMAAITAAAGAAWVLQLGYSFFPMWLSQHMTMVGLIALIATGGPAVVRFVPILENPAIRKIILQVLILLAGFIAPIVAVALFYGFTCLGTIDATVLVNGSTYQQVVGLQAFGTLVLHVNGIWILVGITTVLAIIAVFVNINLTAPHRLYRDRLAKTFIQGPDTGDSNVFLETLNGPNGGAPYHLINAAVNLPASQKADLRERKCDFFLFSKHWCGSPTTGYHRTFEEPQTDGAQKPKPEEIWKMNNGKPDLATAMAISGAAVSPYMGLVSMPTLTSLLAFLNVRLGFWILNPEITAPLMTQPGFSCILREMTGIGMSEKKKWLNLTDGGHIENMGVYELLRRRCKFIICVDGEADPDFTYIGLITMVRHAQIDLGVRIEIDMSDLRPNPTTSYSATHSVLCCIHYPPKGQDKQIGLLLYLKLSLTGNESEVVKRYRKVHPEFPHQSTLDQFFDQEQFEAYRQLGAHITEGLFAKALVGADPGPFTVKEWFRRLSEKLLMPEKLNV